MDTGIHLLSCHEYGLLLFVSIRMFNHAIFPNETFTTNLTGERLLARVQAHVSSQVRLVVELFGTNLAFVWLVARMLGQVLLKK